MKCNKCSFENIENAKFCIKCGSPILVKKKKVKKVLSEEEKEKKQLKKQRRRKIYKKIAIILFIISALCVGAYFANEYYKEIQYEKERSIKLAIIKEKNRVLQEKENKERVIRLEKERINQEIKNKKRLAEQRKTDAIIQSIVDDMIKVEGGTFNFGENPVYGTAPNIKVSLDDYYIGKYEVTQLQWKTIMGNNPSFYKGDNLPVERVTWEMTQEFIKALNKKTKKTFKLPTEAQWEFAYLGGNKRIDYEYNRHDPHKQYRYSGSSNVDEVAWHTLNSGKKSHPVGQKKANELGIYDMSGNIREWCYDCYEQFSDSYYLTKSMKNPIGPLPTDEYAQNIHVTRGGYYDIPDTFCSLAHRRQGEWTPSKMNLKSLGFRLALED